MGHYTKEQICHFDLYTWKKCNIIRRERRGRQQLDPACLDRPSLPAQHHRPYVHAADEPDPPVSPHAPHAAASGQADKRAPSVSRPATVSSSFPRSHHHVTGSQPTWQVRARGWNRSTGECALRARCAVRRPKQGPEGGTSGRDDKSVPLVIHCGERNSAHDVSLRGPWSWAGLVAGWVGLAQFPSLLFPFLFLFLFVLCYTSFMYINQSGIFLLWYNVPWW